MSNPSSSPSSHLTPHLRSPGPAPAPSADVDPERRSSSKEQASQQHASGDLIVPRHIDSLQDAAWTESLSPTGRDLLRQKDWTKTTIGPPSTWPHALRLYTHMLFAEPKAAILCWGKDRITIYNEKWIPLLGSYHPALLGGTFEEVMPPVFLAWQPIFDGLEAGQLGISQEGWDITQNRYGYPEESFWDGSILSIKNDTGGYGGMYSTWTDITKSVLQDRRTKLLDQLANTKWHNDQSVWEYIHQGLLSSPRDVSMALLYGNGDENSVSQQMLLQKSIGLTPAYAAAPPVIDLAMHYDNSLLGPLLRRARDSHTLYTLLDLQEGSTDPELTDHIDWRGFGEPSRYLAIIPLRARNSIRGYCILGLNPRRMMDQGHKDFLVDLTRELCDLMRKATVDERDQQTELLRRELSEHERRIKKLVEVVPSGVYAQRFDGTLIWANQRFFQIMNVPPNQLATFDWRNFIDERDHEAANQLLEDCIVNGNDISGDMRLKKRPDSRPSDGTNPYGDTPWIHFSACPEPGTSGDTAAAAVMGCVIDISQQKWIEGQQQRNVEQARAEKRKLEDFIDITSHEMRNPLSAVLQCAESMSLAMNDMRKLTDSPALLSIIEENEETAESILTCVAHQRRIVDDILTLSKLNSQLLTITPMAFDVQSLVNESLRMLGSEFDANAISVEVTHDMISILPANATVRGDSARLAQILVNLLTNALKFTKKRDIRKVSIRSGIVDSIPVEDALAYEFQWSESPRTVSNIQSGKIHPSEDAIYLYFAITDSGIGIPADQVHKLFSKFEQGNLITFTKYGGSGLGLYISRELTELHGGRIGLSSVLDVGSTFAFYVQVRRPIERLLARPLTAEAPTEISEQVSSVQADVPRIKRSVLLVEDNLLNQKILAKQLQKAGCIVLIADHGGQAVDYVLKMLGRRPEFDSNIDTSGLTSVDSILMDWEMPVCDGLRATRRIREIEAESGCPPNKIIGITANAREGQIIEAMNAGMDFVLTKPFKVVDAITKIDEFKQGQLKQD